ncbi:MAG: acetyl-CoA carboxylase carboxyltransferase subunit alpha [Capsulimonadaceae bacterium]
MADRNVLDFLRSIAGLEEDLAKLRVIAADPAHPENKPDLVGKIALYERQVHSFLLELFGQLTPWDKVLLARHEKRPYTLDYVAGMISEFRELHGDRTFADDGAIVAGMGRLGGIPIVLVGHQKGRDLRQRQHRNFGYARPEGYRKAVRVMKLGAKFGLPIVTLVDTPGAWADVASDERGISEAIARSMYEMSQLPTPIVTAVIGEGGSGGALGIAVADRVVMLEHSVYSVIAPEGCAAILWRDPERKAEAASALKLTAQHALEFGIIEEVVPEPLGGAHRNWDEAAETLQAVLIRHVNELIGTPGDQLVRSRYDRFRRIGQFQEIVQSGLNGHKPALATSETAGTP